MLKSTDPTQIENEETVDSTEEAQEELEESQEDAGEETTKPESSDEPEQEEKPEEAEAEPEERPVYTMPVAKAQAEKQKAVEKAQAAWELEKKQLVEEYEKKLSSGQPQEWDKRLDEVAEKHGLNKEAAKELLETFKLALPDLSKYDEVIKKTEIEAHKIKASEDFDNKVVDLIKRDYPSATSAHISKVKDAVMQLAFTKQFNTYRLEDIYTINKGQFEYSNKHTGETSSSRSSDVKDIDNLSEAEALKLPPKEYAKWADKQAAKQSQWTNVI